MKKKKNANQFSLEHFQRPIFVWLSNRLYGTQIWISVGQIVQITGNVAESMKGAPRHSVSYKAIVNNN